MFDRVIGINGIRFIHTQEMRQDRRNIIYTSKQFQPFIDHEKNKFTDEHCFEFQTHIQKLFTLHQPRLTDVVMEIAGYY